MNFNFSHVVGIIGGALSAIAGLNPAVVAAVYPPAVPYAAAAIAAASALLALGHAVMTKPKAPTASVVVPEGATATVITKVTPDATKVVPVLIAFMLAVSLTGCASLKSFFGSPTGQAVAVAAVDVAVATAEQKGVNPVDINRIAKLALAADSGVSGTLAALSQLVNAEIAKLNLPAGDLAAVQVLEIALTAAIQSKLQGNVDLATAQATVAQVLNEVIAATGG
jgi:hypothetical protein